MGSVAKVAYLTDVEGMWSRLASFARDNPLLALEADDRIVMQPGARFVFGGDAIDRGPDGRRLVRTLTAAKLAYPDQVFLLAGNRDINKLRLWHELQDRPHPRMPDEARGDAVARLRWIFQHTMGAGEAFAMRLAELGPRATEADVPLSYLADLQPDGALTRYLGLCQLALRLDSTLFVHGAVTPENLGRVPASEQRTPEIDAWVERLNAWYRHQIEAFRTRTVEPNGTPSWEGIVAYQAPHQGTRLNQGSVVYGRLTDDLQNPHLPARAVIRALLEQGIGRLAVGHTPSGAVPSLRRAEGFALLVADNSHGRVDTASRVLIEGDAIGVQGRTVLDSGETVELGYRVQPAEPSFVGQVDLATGHLVKGPLTDGRFNLWRGLANYRVEQVAISPRALTDRRLGPPPFAP